MNVEYDDNDVKHSDGEEHHKQIKCPTGVGIPVTFDTLVTKGVHCWAISIIALRPFLLSGAHVCSVRVDMSNFI